jgi:ABC-type transporter Mla MlaB component
MASAPTVVIGFSGSVTIRNIEDYAQQLRQALAEADHVEIDLTQLDEVDFTFIQLLIAALNTAQSQGKTLFLSQPVGGVVLDALTILGGDSGARRGFWFKEEVA